MKSIPLRPNSAKSTLGTQSSAGHVLILNDIRSAQNVGSLFRTADAVGIKEIYLVGITPTPLDKFGRPVGAIAKTALGAESTIVWKHVATIAPLLTRLKKEGYTTVAIEQSDTSIDYKKVVITGPTAFILGNEVEGISKAVLGKMDVVAEIPMNGEKESLNVSVAGGVALFRMLNR
ncbi:MAG: TrmH family RNA methyltransferase [Minisyncoccia bacterium]